MSKNAMAGAVTLCGVGLCMIGGALLMQNGQQAHAAAGSVPPAAAAVAAMATSQAGPTVVWYGTEAQGNTDQQVVYRAWSDGTIEAMRVSVLSGTCAFAVNCGDPGSGWRIISSPDEGLKAAADFDADELVNGSDLAVVLSNWGDAPRVAFPPSDCPLNLVNP